MGKTRNKTYLNTFKMVEEEMLPFVGEKENFMKDIYGWINGRLVHN